MFPLVLFTGWFVALILPAIALATPAIRKAPLHLRRAAVGASAVPALEVIAMGAMMYRGTPLNGASGWMHPTPHVVVLVLVALAALPLSTSIGTSMQRFPFVWLLGMWFGVASLAISRAKPIVFFGV